ncbi:hypothetical protein [Gallaecimonas sp. GXIMD4217]|uniref:TraR/DksA family transcriptional regulator n=1 Tax=Gallaecimonas sp. GXIMD4217 TaxID=3131927 RepID=UPI00311B26E7
MLAASQLTEFRQRLEKEQNTLLAQTATRLTELGVANKVIYALRQQGLDGIQQYVDALHDRQLHGLTERLGRVEAALCQLDLGLFGLCADCESEIPPRLLDSDPTTQRCNDCQSG